MTRLPWLMTRRNGAFEHVALHFCDNLGDIAENTQGPHQSNKTKRYADDSRRNFKIECTPRTTHQVCIVIHKIYGSVCAKFNRNHVFDFSIFRRKYEMRQE